MNNRIEVIKEESLNDYGINGDIVMFRDTQTGVLYMHSRIATSGGLTPLIDENGKPIVMKLCKECGFSLTKEMISCPECGCPVD